MWTNIIILSLVTLQRLVELYIAQRNTRRLLANGGFEVGSNHYPLMVALHTIWLAGLWYLVLFQNPTVSMPWIIAYLVLEKVPLSRNFDLSILAAALLVSTKCLFLLYGKKLYVMDNVSKHIFMFGYIILPFVLITKIPIGINGYNPKIIISIFILIWTNDTFAYIVGKSIGKHKLFETISPKKTIEGFVGGVCFATLAGYFISRYYFDPKETYLSKSIIIWTITAFIVGIFGTIGDLVQSKFKRLANVKDSGKIMPGHGGILDRLDSVIFVAPFVYLFYQILNYVTLP